jgi:hypothetical protein
MNCRPNELAFIVSAEGTACEITRMLIGRIVRVTQLRQSGPYCSHPIVWEFEEPIHVTLRGRDWIVTGGADSALRPIRGEPGRDETLEWVPGAA